MAGFRPYIVGIGGTTRPGSSSEKALRYALALAEAQGADVKLLTGQIDGEADMLGIETRAVIEAWRYCGNLR